MARIKEVIRLTYQEVLVDQVTLFCIPSLLFSFLPSLSFPQSIDPALQFMEMLLLGLLTWTQLVDSLFPVR